MQTSPSNSQNVPPKVEQTQNDQGKNQKKSRKSIPTRNPKKPGKKSESEKPVDSDISLLQSSNRLSSSYNPLEEHKKDSSSMPLKNKQKGGEKAISGQKLA